MEKKKTVRKIDYLRGVNEVTLRSSEQATTCAVTNGQVRHWSNAILNRRRWSSDAKAAQRQSDDAMRKVSHMKACLIAGLFLTLGGCGAAPTLRVMAEGTSPDVSDTRESLLKRPPNGEEVSLPIRCPESLGAAHVWLGLGRKKIDLKIACAVHLPGARATPASNLERHTLTFNGVLPRRGKGAVESLHCPKNAGLIDIKVILNKHDYLGTVECASEE